MPWQNTAVVFANQVIVFGTSGIESGVFVYTGTPALGNPPVIALTSSSKDPYGNVITSGDELTSTTPYLIVLDHTSGRYIQLATLASLGAFMSLGSGDSQETQPGIVNSNVVGSGPTRQLATTFQSPQFSNVLSAAIEILSASQDGSTFGSQIQGNAGASANFTLGNDPNGNPVFSLAQKLVMSAGAFIYASTPLTQNQETWHAMSPLSGGFSAAAGSLTPSYRLKATGEIAFRGAVTLPSSGSYNSVTFFTVPFGYHRTDFASRAGIPYIGAYPASYVATTGSPRLFLDTSGNVQVAGLPSGENSQNCDISCSMDLT